MNGEYKLVADYNLWIMQNGNKDKGIWAIHDERGNYLFDVLNDDYNEMLDLDLVDDGYMLAPHTEEELLDYQKRWGILWTEMVSQQKLSKIMTIREKYYSFIKEHDVPPRFATATVVFKNEVTKIAGMNFSMGTTIDDEEEYDDILFFYCNDLKHLESLAEKTNGEDFYIVSDSVEFTDEI